MRWLQFDPFSATKTLSTPHLVAIIMLLSQVSFSQRRTATFGQRIDMQLGYEPAAMTLMSDRGSHTQEVAVLVEGTRDLFTYIFTADGKARRSHSYVSPFSSATLAGTRILALDGNEFVLYSPRESLVGITTPRRSAGVTMQVPSGYDRISASDINNDGRRDLLLYGKSASGVLPLFREPSGAYKQGTMLFPDISVGDVVTSDLNRDRITDILLTDWLSNRLILFFGIGRTVFSEQISIDLPGEPGELTLLPLKAPHAVRVAVTIPEAKEIRVFTIDATGEFHPSAILHSALSPGDVRLADVNGDGVPEVISGIDGGLIVFQESPASSQTQQSVFSMGGDATDWEVGDFNDDGNKDVVSLDRKGERLSLLANANSPKSLAYPNSYAVGIHPEGMTVGDFNHDGLTDIAVVNMVEPSLSVLLNTGDGKMDGQITSPLAESPSFVRSVSEDSTPGATFFVSHTSSSQVTVTQWATGSSSSYNVPTGPNPYVILAKQEHDRRISTFLVRNNSSMEHSASLSLFEQLSAAQFIETSIRPSLPQRVTAISVNNLGKEGANNLMFAAHDRTQQRTGIYLAKVTNGFSFENPRLLFSFMDSVGSARSLVNGFFDPDGSSDLIVVLGPPISALVVAHGTENFSISDSLQWIHGVQPLNEDSFIVRDVNGDGRSDLCFIDAASRSVAAFFGRQEGGFEKKTICPAEGVTSIRVAALKTPEVNDLVLSREEKGTISILFNPFRR